MDTRVHPGSLLRLDPRRPPPRSMRAGCATRGASPSTAAAGAADRRRRRQDRGGGRRARARAPAGADFGWPAFEGDQRRGPGDPPGLTASRSSSGTPTAGARSPAATSSATAACSRSPAATCSPTSARAGCGAPRSRVPRCGRAPARGHRPYPVSFGEDARGRVYVVDFGGRALRLTDVRAMKDGLWRHARIALALAVLALLAPALPRRGLRPRGQRRAQELRHPASRRSPRPAASSSCLPRRQRQRRSPRTCAAQLTQPRRRRELHAPAAAAGGRSPPPGAALVIRAGARSISCFYRPRRPKVTQAVVRTSHGDRASATGSRAARRCAALARLTLRTPSCALRAGRASGHQSPTSAPSDRGSRRLSSTRAATSGRSARRPAPGPAPSAPTPPPPTRPGQRAPDAASRSRPAPPSRTPPRPARSPSTAPARATPTGRSSSGSGASASGADVAAGPAVDARAPARPPARAGSRSPTTAARSTLRAGDLRPRPRRADVHGGAVALPGPGVTTPVTVRVRVPSWAKLPAYPATLDVPPGACAGRDLLRAGLLTITAGNTGDNDAWGRPRARSSSPSTSPAAPSGTATRRSPLLGA